MCRNIKWLTIVAVWLCPLLVRADETAGPERRIAAEDSGAIVTIEVLIADVGPLEKGEALPDDQDIAARIRELEKDAKVSRVTRTRATTLSEQTAMVQFGERAPMATGRVFRGGGGGFAGGPGGAGGGGDSSMSYSYQNIGTLVSVTPRVDAGNVILECNVECTRVALRKPAADKPEGAFEPTGLETISAKSAVRVKSGETALLASKQQSSAEGTTRTYVLVTATIQDAGRKEAAAIKIFTLTHAKASVAAEMLKPIFEDSAIRLGVDERTNSLVAHGNAGDLALVEQLLLRLDDK
jgi:hypothetical protein